MWKIAVFTSNGHQKFLSKKKKIRERWELDLMLLLLNFFVFRFQIISSWDTVNTASGLILRTFREKLCHRVIYEYFCMKKLQNVVVLVQNNVRKVFINSLHSNFWKKFIKMWFFRLKTLTPPWRVYDTWIFDQKFDSIRISTLCGTTKPWKNQPYWICQEHLFCIIIFPESLTNW